MAAFSKTEPRGFTLIEVLVALAILAVLASTIVLQSGNYGANLFRLEEKAIALWVAQNALDESRLAERLSDGTEEDEAEMGGRTWIVARSVSATARPGFHRVVVEVSRDDEDEEEQGVLVTLTGFVADR